MRRLFLALAAGLGLTFSSSIGAGADISLTETTQATLSCNDGHSVVLFVDPTELTSLTNDVGSINTSGTGMLCTLDTTSIDPTMSTSDWTVYDYNPSEQGIHPRNGPNSMPATTSDGGMTWTFPFIPNVFTALFTTTDPSVTGNMSGKTLSDTISLNGDAASFTTQKQCDKSTLAQARLYFTSHSSSGSSSPAPGQPVQGGTPPRGFYTNFWWSKVEVNLLAGTQNPAGNLAASMSDPSEWTDWDGQSGDTQAQAFMEAAQNVQSIGLSFGGDCFFETGATPTPPTFNSEKLSNQFTAQ